MLLELEEKDYIDMGLGRALVRTMLRRAKEIATTTSAPVAESKPVIPSEPQPEPSDSDAVAVTATGDDGGSSNSAPVMNSLPSESD